MEHGGAEVGGGWLGRWLRQRGSAGAGALTALAFGTAVPESLRGAPRATALRAFSDLGFGADAERPPQQLGPPYAGDVTLADAARDALDAPQPLASLHERTCPAADRAGHGT